MAVLFTVTERQIARDLRERGLPIESFDDLTRGERELVQEYIGVVFNMAKRELLDMLAQAIRRRRGLPD
jgi:hypothetical protein